MDYQRAKEMREEQRWRRLTASVNSIRDQIQWQSQQNWLQTEMIRQELFMLKNK